MIPQFLTWGRGVFLTENNSRGPQSCTISYSPSKVANGVRNLVLDPVHYQDGDFIESAIFVAGDKSAQLLEDNVNITS